MLKSVYCIVLNWNGKHFLKSCLDSLLRSNYKNVKFILVDNGSTDGSQAFIKKNYPNVKLIENKENLGWAEANNKGVDFALKNNADCVFILNNDLIVERNCLDILVAELFANPKISIVGPKIYLSKKGKKTKTISFAGGNFTSNRYFGVHRGINKLDKGQFEKKIATEFITGAAIMIKSNIIRQIGGFDKRFFIYYEEADFCKRVTVRKSKILFVPKAIAYHEFSGTIKINSPLQNYYTTRNHYLFVEKNAPWSVKLREWLRTPKTIFEFLINKDQVTKKYSLLGIRDYYLRRFGKRIYW